MQGFQLRNTTLAVCLTPGKPVGYKSTLAGIEVMILSSTHNHHGAHHHANHHWHRGSALVVEIEH